MYRSECLVVSGEEEAKGSSEVPDSHFVKCVNISHFKDKFPHGE